ncbi:MAG TPA: hypothetical protein PLT65_04525 [Bacilli bacterium]|nr:hypothetical protein [Bacilli bacterium]
MYRFKYYYKDGTTKVSDCKGDTPESMYNDFDGLMDWDKFENLSSQKLTTSDILKLAMSLYRGFIDDYYRIEIIDDETNKIIDYIEESEVNK